MNIKPKYISFLIPLILIICIMLFPEISIRGATKGLVLSANVIIPSLFPFMVCVLMFVKNGFNAKHNFLNNILYKLFGQNFEMFFVFVLSMIGGFPVGAKLINGLYEERSIDNKTANVMLQYCVNAGPAFVIMVAGKALGSYTIGKILLVSHLLSSIIIASFCGKILRKNNCCHKPIKKTPKPFSAIITESVSDASGSILSVCSFVIFFAVINSFLEYFFRDMPILKYIPYFTEVTFAVSNENNILFISFLLGFSGISIWFQIFTLAKNIKLDIKKFIFGRILHGALSVIFTKTLLCIFNVKVTTFSNNIIFNNNLFYSDVFLFLSMFIMLIVLLVFIYSKNNSGKLLKDMV